VTHFELFQRYMFAGAISHNPDAVAELFTDDGVYEAPLIPDGHVLPRSLEGREAIRAGVPAFHAYPGFQGTVMPERSRFALHETADPDVFVTEIDTVLARDGEETAVSVVQIFHLRDGRIRLLRDYFSTVD
jgi:ketosteroid isomerase-like protein